MTVGAPFFNTVAVPVGLTLLFLMAVAPVLSWRKMNGAALWVTQAEVSARITLLPAGVRPRGAHRSHGRPASPGLPPVYGLSGEVPESELDGLGHGTQTVAVHNDPEVSLFDLDIRAPSGHTPILHLRCRIGVLAPPRVNPYSSATSVVHPVAHQSDRTTVGGKHSSDAACLARPQHALTRRSGTGRATGYRAAHCGSRPACPCKWLADPVGRLQERAGELAMDMCR